MIEERIPLETKFGDFKAARHMIGNTEIVTLECDDITLNVPLVRIHSGCMFGDVFGSKRCDCGPQRDAAMEAIKRNRRGVFAYSPSQEGRGHGLGIKMREIALQIEHRIDSVEALNILRLPADLRTFEKEVAALKELELPTVIWHFSGSNAKRVALEVGGFTIQRQFETCQLLGPGALAERDMKVRHLGHDYIGEREHE